MSKILIIEDQKLILKRLRDIVADLGAQVYMASNVADAYQIAMEQNIDIFLVDIALDGTDQADVSGANFAAAIRQIPHYSRSTIIFITSLEDPKWDAFNRIHCYRYIEKPFSAEEVKSVVYEAMQLPPIKAPEKKYINLRYQGIYFAKEIKSIVYIETNQHKMQLHSTEGVCEITYKTLDQILKELDSDRFLRCSRNTIVNRDYILQVDEVNRYITLKGEYPVLEIGSRMKKKFLKQYLQER